MGCTGASRDAPTSFGFMVLIYGEMVERGKFSGGHESRPYSFGFMVFVWGEWYNGQS